MFNTFVAELNPGDVPIAVRDTRVESVALPEDVEATLIEDILAE